MTSLTYLPSKSNPTLLSQIAKILKLNSGCWCRLILSFRSILRYFLPKGQEARKTLGFKSRVSSTSTFVHSRSSFGNQHVLAGLVSKIKYPLGRPRAVGLDFRTRIPDNLHLASHIRHRCIQNLLRQCTCILGDHAEHRGRIVPPRCGSALYKTWSLVGNVDTWVCQHRVHPYPLCIVVLWALDPEKKSILPTAVGGRHEQKFYWDADA